MISRYSYWLQFNMTNCLIFNVFNTNYIWSNHIYSQLSINYRYLLNSQYKNIITLERLNSKLVTHMCINTPESTPAHPNNAGSTVYVTVLSCQRWMWYLFIILLIVERVSTYVNNANESTAEYLYKIFDIPYLTRP